MEIETLLRFFACYGFVCACFHVWRGAVAAHERCVVLVKTASEHLGRFPLSKDEVLAIGLMAFAYYLGRPHLQGTLHVRM